MTYSSGNVHVGLASYYIMFQSQEDMWQYIPFMRENTKLYKGGFD